jgi:ammonia channel protein AmtB
MQTLLPAVGYPGPPGSSGIFYKGDGKQLGIQLLGALVVFLWSLGLSLGLFLLLKALKVLRVPAASEGIGEQDIQLVWYRLVAALVGLLWPLGLFWDCCCCIRRHK